MSVTKTCRDISELNPLAQKACNLFMSECQKAGLKVLITETYRSQARQNYLYEQGRTRAGNIVTWTKSSRHTSRMAWDICKNVKGQEYSDAKFFEQCGAIAKRLGITWGGTWATPDKPHFEITSKWTYTEPKEAYKVEQIEIKVDGKKQKVNRVLVNQNNFVKIRDIAPLLGYKVDSVNGVVTLTKK